MIPIREGPQGIIYTNLLLKAGWMLESDQIAQGSIQLGLENLHE